MDTDTTHGHPNAADVQPVITHDLEQLPARLRRLDRWVLWRYLTRNGKPTKIPFDAKTGREASSTDSTTWSSLPEVVHALGGGTTFSGLGFVFAEGDGLCGVDLDRAIDPGTKKLKPWAKRIVRDLNSYTEISPSGTGVKIFIAGVKPRKRCRTAIEDGEIEIYDRGRYFTTTGQRWPGTPADVEDRQNQLDALYEQVFEPEPVIATAPTPPQLNNTVPNCTHTQLTDDEILNLARGQRRTGAKFAALYDTGDWEAHFGSQSEADSSLIFTLTFYTKDVAQLDRLFRGSQLLRPKWDQLHGEQTYGQMTIEKALQKVTKQYQPHRPRPGNKQTDRPDAVPAEDDTADIVPLGERDPSTGRLVLSSKRTRPTAVAYQRDFYTHPDGRTLHYYAGMLMTWRHGRFVEIEDVAVRNQLQPWLHDALKYVTDRRTGEMVLTDFDANPGTVKQAFETICNHVYLDANTASPSWLSTLPGGENPPADELLPCCNTVLHLPTGRRIKPSPRLFTVNALDFDPDPEATMPEEWFRFLDQLFGEDEESTNLLQEWFGYCLNSDTSQQKMLLMVGPRRSGKGTIGRVLSRLVGEGNVCGPTTSGLAGSFGLQPLVGKSLAIVSDARFSGDSIQTVVERLLCISGEDALTIERKHKTSVTMKLPTRFMFMTNELPRLHDASGALAGRFMILQLSQSFYGQEDRNLTAKLLDELPGILNWAIEGWRRLRERGHFVQPSSVEDAIHELEDLASPVGAFVRDKCMTGSGYRIDVDSLYRAYRQWCEAEGRQAIATKTTFGRDILAAVPGVRARRNHSTGRFYEGLALSEGCL